MATTGTDRRPAPPAWIGVLCALAVAIPFYGLAIWSGISVHQEGKLELSSPLDSLLQAIIVTVLFCGLTWLLLTRVLRESVSSLSRGGSRLWTDMLHAVNISLLLLTAQVLIAVISGQDASSGSDFNRVLGEHLAKEPLALWVWLGPVAWLQAGLTEEFTRAFILSRLWRMWPGDGARFTAVLLMSVLFGFGHFYQGWIGVAGTFMIGMVFGLHYLRFRSLRALVIGHGLYDMVVMLLIYWGTEQLSVPN